MPSYKKPAKAEDDSRRATDGDSGAADVPTGPDWSLGQVPAEDAVLSGVFALRPARIPDDVYAFALSLNADGSERAQMETDEVDDLSDISEGPPPPPPDSDVDGHAPTFEVEAAAQIGRAITELSRLREDLLLDAETQLIELAGVIARRVVARELRTDSSFLRSLVKEGLAQCPGFAGYRDRCARRVRSCSRRRDAKVRPALHPRNAEPRKARGYRRRRFKSCVHAKTEDRAAARRVPPRRPPNPLQHGCRRRLWRPCGALLGQNLSHSRKPTSKRARSTCLIATSCTCSE